MKIFIKVSICFSFLHSQLRVTQKMSMELFKNKRHCNTCCHCKHIYTLDLHIKTQRRFLECGVCTEIYNEDERVPIQLPCLHTFCSACLKIICSKRNIKCSLCKASHKVDKKGPENFGKDNTRRDLLLFLRENANENGLQLCTKCSEIITIWFNCDACSIILCSECKVFHEEEYSNHRLRNTKK